MLQPLAVLAMLASFTVHGHARNADPEVPPKVAQPMQWSDDPEERLQFGIGQNGTNTVWKKYGAVGDPATVIAVIDSGIDYTHPDLVANLWRDPVDGSIGHDFVDGDERPWDRNGHGTHVAGVAAAVGGNGIGIAGQCPRCSIMALRVFDSQGVASDDRVVAAVNYAVAHGASVISFAWGSPDDSQALRDALENAIDAGKIIVTAAGDEGVDLSSARFFPAKYRMTGLLTVAGLYESPVGFPFWTNSGKPYTHLSSAGADVYSTWPSGMYAYQSGTSMAAAQVAGAAALIRSYRPKLEPRKIVDLLKAVTQDPDSKARTVFGGRPDMAKIFSKIR